MRLFLCALIALSSLALVDMSHRVGALLFKPEAEQLQVSEVGLRELRSMQYCTHSGAAVKSAGGGLKCAPWMIVPFDSILLQWMIAMPCYSQGIGCVSAFTVKPSTRWSA